MQDRRVLWSLAGPLLVISLLALALCGCGTAGSSSTGSASTATSSVPVSDETSITKAELIKKGDVVCERNDSRQSHELEAYTKQHPHWEKTPKGQENAIATAGLPPIALELEELAAIGAPNGDSDKVGAILSALERGLKEAEEDPGVLLTGEGTPFDAGDHLAKAYGFKACSDAF